MAFPSSPEPGAMLIEHRDRRSAYFFKSFQVKHFPCDVAHRVRFLAGHD
jgi:hypothetical protein